MWLMRGGAHGHSYYSGGSSGNGPEKRRGIAGNSVVAVAIDNDKGSRYALKWAVEHLLTRGQTIVLIHVIHKPTPSASPLNYGTVLDKQQLDKQVQELFLTFHCGCTRKEIKCLDIVLEDTDIAKALTEYVSYAAIEYLVLGASSRHGFIRRFKISDVPSTVTKGVPDFCTVYVISKGKISTAKRSSRPAPFASPLLEQIQDTSNSQDLSGTPRSTLSFCRSMKVPAMTPRKPRNFPNDYESPIAPGRGWNPKMFGDLSESDTDISFVSSERPSTDRMSSAMLCDSFDSARTSCVSTSTDFSFGSPHFGVKGSEISPINEFSSSSLESDRTSCSSHDDTDAEMRRLKLELQKTMDLYSTACKEALTAKQKAEELQRWRAEEEQRLEEARLAEKAARIDKDREKAKLRMATETNDASQRIADREAQRRVSAEMKVLNDTESSDYTPIQDYRYRRYTIDDIEAATNYFAESQKIGEGGYGPVFKCKLDHTPVAVKVLRPDAAHGRSQFQQEVEVLSCMRHPNMVLLLGACPEYGCLIYEYMANGSLDDRLLRRGNTPPLSWQIRFKIAAEIATGMLFLHQTKPEPIVHRDLKPGNILLDQNFVSKISDVGLARLLPPSVAEDVTQYRMTSTAGTFCYIDPEYQQTGMLGVKSDVYSLGIMLLQMITGKPPMGLTHTVRRAIEQGTLADMLDPNVPDWPMEETFCFAKLAIQCAELRRKDRPDLGKVVLPELNRLRELAEENMIPFVLIGNSGPSSSHSQEAKSDPSDVNSEHNSSKDPTSSSSPDAQPSEPTN